MNNSIFGNNGVTSGPTTGNEMVYVTIHAGDPRKWKLWFAATTFEQANAALARLPKALIVNVYCTGPMRTSAGWDENRPSDAAFVGSTSNLDSLAKQVKAAIKGSARLRGAPPQKSEQDQIKLESWQLTGGSPNLTEKGWLFAAANHVARSSLED